MPSPATAHDLNPVTFHDAPSHAPLVLVKDGTRQDHWTLEARLPIAGFDGARRPGTGVAWHGQITRHRNRRGKTVGGGKNQKRNAAFDGRNNNIADFAPFAFVE